MRQFVDIGNMRESMIYLGKELREMLAIDAINFCYDYSDRLQLLLRLL